MWKYLKEDDEMMTGTVISLAFIVIVLFGSTIFVLNKALKLEDHSGEDENEEQSAESCSSRS